MHIDCDWYEPVMLCLERLHPLLSPGGYVIADDYFDWEGRVAPATSSSRRIPTSSAWWSGAI